MDDAVIQSSDVHHHHHMPTGSGGAVDQLMQWLHGSAPALDPLTIAGFVAMLTYSLMVSLHCGVMCGPLLAVRYGQTGWRSPGIWIYNLGRGLGYSAVGALAGGLVAAVTGVTFAAFSRVVAVAVGGTLIGIGLFWPWRAALASGVSGRRLSAIAARAGARLAGLTARVPAWSGDLLLGVGTAILPCMTLAMAMAAAAASGDMVRGGLTMTTFWLGTLPVMALAPVMPGKVVRFAPGGIPGWLSGMFLVLTGLLTLARAWH